LYVAAQAEATAALKVVQAAREDARENCDMDRGMPGFWQEDCCDEWCGRIRVCKALAALDHKEE
jgi:hypothetical protein